MMNSFQLISYLQKQRNYLKWICLICLLALISSTLSVRAISMSVSDPDPNAINNGLCSLIEAIENANADTAVWPDCPAGNGHDVIVLDPGVAVIYSLTAVHNSIDGANGLPSITSDITIEGNHTTITRDLMTMMPFRIFHVSKNGNLKLNQLTVIKGWAAGSGWGDDGGGIFNRGSVTITHSTISKHTADDRGGAILNHGLLFVTESVISGNESLFGGGGIANIAQSKGDLLNSTMTGNLAISGNGGAIYNHHSELTISGSTIYDNAAINGGGIHIEGGLATLTNSTISSNGASPGNGGGIYNGDGASNVSLVHVTVANNHASQGGGIFNLTTNPVFLSNTIVANNFTGNDCNGIITSLDYNLDSDNSCNLILPRDLPAASAHLGSLQNNGGTTQTHQLLPLSDALDAADNAVCTAVPVNSRDQRGFHRPANGTCDIGAYEQQTHSGNLVYLPILQNDHDQKKGQMVRLLHQAMPDLKNFRLDGLDGAHISAQLKAGKSVSLPFVANDAPGNEHSPPEYREIDALAQEKMFAETTLLLAVNPNQMLEIEPPTVEIFHTAVFTPLLPITTLLTSCDPDWLTDCWVSGYVKDNDGWSFIEPIELMLLRAGFDPAEHRELLAAYNHVAYNIHDVTFTSPHDVGEEGAEFLKDMLTELPTAVLPTTDKLAETGLSTTGQHIREPNQPATIPPTAVTFSLWADYEFSAEEAGIIGGLPLTNVDVVPAYFRLLATMVAVRDNLQTAVPNLNTFVDTIRFEASPTAQCLTATSRSTLLAQSRTCPHTDLQNADLVHVFSGKIGGGLAPIRGLLAPPDCTSRYPAYICTRSGVHNNHGVEGRTGTLSSQILLATHEIGHNLGATHGNGNSHWGFTDDEILVTNFPSQDSALQFDDLLCGHDMGGTISFYFCGNFPLRYFDPDLDDYVLFGAARRIMPPYLLSLANAGLPGDTFLVGDFNGDTLQDLAIGRPTGGLMTWRVALHKPAATSSYKLFAPVLWHIGLGSSNSQFFAADFDGDGLDDLGFTESGAFPTLTWNVATSTGTSFTLSSPGGQWSAQIGSQSDIFLVGDFSGDALADVAIGHAATATDMVWRTAVSNGTGFDGGPHYPIWHADIGDDGDHFMTGDFNGDGLLDLAVGKELSSTQVQWQVATAKEEFFENPTVWAGDIGDAGDRFLMMDINGDGRDDIVYGHLASAVSNGPYAWIGHESTGINFATSFHILSFNVCLGTTLDSCGTDIMLYGYGYGYINLVPSFGWANKNNILAVLETFNTYP